MTSLSSSVTQGSLEGTLEFMDVLISSLDSKAYYYPETLVKLSNQRRELKRKLEPLKRLSTPKFLYNCDSVGATPLETPRKRKSTLLKSPRRRHLCTWLKAPFVYEPLLEGFIRVLNLHPGSFDMPLGGTLEIERVEDHPSYKAISYAWGDPIFAHTLHLPQGELRITKSLHGALRRFRSITEPVRLWADAICIDQQGLEEKNHQVNRMADVYNRAQEVLVWLGEGNQSSNQDCIAFWMLRFLAFYAALRVDYSQQRPPIVAAKDLVSDLLDIYSPSDPWLPLSCGQSLRETRCPCGKSWQMSFSRYSQIEMLNIVTTNIWKTPWFGRLWVIQEITKAASATFFLGAHSINGKDLEVAAKLHLASIKIPDVKHIQINQATDAVEKARRMLTMELHSSDFAGQRQNLLHQILQTSDFFATEPHDRLSSAELWKRVAIFILTQHSFREADDPVTDYAPALLLALVGTQGRMDAIPSWVPNFGDFKAESRRKHQFYMHEYRKFWAGGNANTLRTFEALPDSDTDVLTIQGNFHSMVQKISRGSECNRPSNEWERISWENRNNLVDWCQKCYDFVKEEVADIELEIFTWEQLMQHGLEVNERRFQTDKSVAKFVNEDLARHIRASDAGILLDVITPFLSNDNPVALYLDSTRVLASTTTGNLGWIPNTSKPGDRVCVFRGAPFPFVVREREDGFYTLIGDAYIQGIMHGEAWSDDYLNTIMIGLR